MAKSRSDSTIPQAQQILYLLRKYRNGDISFSESEELNAWMAQSAENKRLFEQLISEENQTAAVEKMRGYHTPAKLLELKAAMRQQREQQVGYRKLYRYAAIAASIVLVCGAGFYFYQSHYNRSLVHDYADEYGLNNLKANDIAPGKNTATLTLANGKTINLSALKTGIVIQNTGLTYADGSVVKPGNGVVPNDTQLRQSPRAGELLNLSTPRGGQYQVVLPDKSTVWLNAESSIKFPATFAGLDNRVVQLTGEAYFEVSKDKQHPFMVKTAKQDVTVLGTHFNINSYANEPEVKTTLLEGAVRVRLASFAALQKERAPQPAEQVILKPGEQATLSGKTLKVGPADIQADLAWKKGDFVFNDEPLENIMRQVARWYNVDVTYATGAPKNLLIGGVVSRSRPISAILERIQGTGKINFKIEGRQITVLP